MKTSILLFFICLGVLSCTPKQRPQTLDKFPVPEVPAILTDAGERVTFLATHYWDRFDFRDTALIAREDITEQGFVDFLSLLPYTAPAKVQAAVDTLYRRAAVRREMLDHFIALGEKYLYEPNSPMRNEELYIPVLRALLASDALGEEEKVRPRWQLEMALKNRPGEVATDFTYTLADGRTGRLSAVEAEYTLLFFNAPDCDECQRARALLTTVAPLPDLVAAGRLAVVAVYPDADLELWRHTEYPATWINGYDAGQVITHKELYSLTASPTIYLLDREKRVLLKDVTVEQLIGYFQR